ncbi:MAG: hypothetical protein JW839_19600 [Candidatus Lokiarchaeota archaeon]|nr:hypothetical protein [Candidatus Lokiarchaeota archaeon]
MSLAILAPLFTGYYHCQFVGTNYLAGLDINVNADYPALNASSWVVPGFKNVSFVFEVESGYPAPVNVTYSVNNYTMGTTDWFKANATEWGEWGYSFHHLTGGALDGAGVAHYGGYPTAPASKREAYTYMRNYVVNFTEHLKNGTRPWISFNGHYPYHHYAAEFGFDAVGSEIGENIDSYQLMMAFNRGAARQYHLPWFVDFSAWMSGTITDYNVPPTWGDSSGPTCGHSLSLFQRSYYMAYMAGTSRVIAEGGCANLFYRTPDPYGLLPLTPLGEVGRDFAHFTADHPNRGIPYTPVGILIDDLHGSNGILSGPPRAFNTLQYNKGDMMTFNLLDTIFPSCWDSPVDEQWALANNEFGDMFDVLLQNASSDVLASYPVVFMSGEIVPRGNESERLVEYVENGGTLFVNSAYFPALNAALLARGHQAVLELPLLQYVKVLPFGNSNGGNFVLFGPDYDATRVRPMLRELAGLVSPFVVTTDGLLGNGQSVYGARSSIQHLVNRNCNGWVLTLINNDGITKEPREAPIIDASKAREVTIRLNDAFLGKALPAGTTLQNVTDWTAGDVVLWDSGGGAGAASPVVELALGPGAVSILEFKFG